VPLAHGPHPLQKCKAVDRNKAPKRTPHRHPSTYTGTPPASPLNARPASPPPNEHNEHNMLSNRKPPSTPQAAAVVRASAPRHMVALGSEGPTPWPGYVRTSLLDDHKAVDYVAIHVWPQNWGWYSPTSANALAPPGTPASAQQGGLDFAWDKARQYVRAAVQVGRTHPIGAQKSREPGPPEIDPVTQREAGSSRNGSACGLGPISGCRAHQQAVTHRGVWGWGSWIRRLSRSKTS